MKNRIPSRRPLPRSHAPTLPRSHAPTLPRSDAATRTAFTLIELLVVIAVIGILAGMVLSVMHGLTRKKVVALASAELHDVTTAIEAYKAKYGFYPPDNPRNVITNGLYFELAGTINAGASYGTLDGSASISTNQAVSVFGVAGFANSATSAGGDDDRSGPVDFIKGIKPDRIATVVRDLRILVCSIGWEGANSATFSLSPWQYNSSHPTNNPNSYDLWVDLYIGGQTNRISNWRNQAQVVYK